MANVIAAGLQLTTVLDAALTAFKQALLPLKAFSTVFQDVPLAGTNKVAVAYYPLNTTASSDFAGTYSTLADATDTQVKEVTVNKRKVKVLSFTSSERARQPIFDPVKHGEMKGRKLAYDVLADILSLVTVANYAGTTLAAMLSTAFDENDVADLAQMCMQADWPAGMRSLVLNPAFFYAVVRRPIIIQADQHGNTTGQTEGDFARLLGFDTYGSNGVPLNGAEKISGFACLPSSILVAGAPIPPADGLKNLVNYEVVKGKPQNDEGDDWGMALEYREFGLPDTDTVIQALECNYGYAIGEAAALKRITIP